MDNYIIVEGYEMGYLITEVNRKIKIGYKPIGGIGIGNQKVYQAMFLEPDNNREQLLRDIEAE